MSTGPNAMTYLVPAVALVAALCFVLYSALDRYGLATEQVVARVTGKQIAAGSTTYNTNVAGGRAWTQASTNPDTLIVLLDIDGVVTGGAVTPELYASLQTGELVHVALARTRFSNRIMVSDVRR
ncbi:MAG TPA: hypothetical protein VKE96_25465 [Vicinamibacterales bacterium]|nr:hypothetical protein [Vicinamibacterales bacterium]